MKTRKVPFVTTAITVLSVILAGCSDDNAQPGREPAAATPPSVAGLESVSPALQRARDEVVEGELWRRPDLSQRDRSIVTVAALITTSATAELPHYVAQALDNGVTPAELSEIITHLAYYAGWPNAMSAVPAANDVFSARGVDVTQLPPATEDLLPLDEAGEARRAATNESNYGAVAPGVLQYTADLLFRDLWLRPALAPRDRSLITVTSLIASGQVAQIPFHLGRAMDNGLTSAQMSETLTQLAFFVGWPKVFTALPVVKDVEAQRPA